VLYVLQSVQEQHSVQIKIYDLGLVIMVLPLSERQDNVVLCSASHLGDPVCSINSSPAALVRKQAMRFSKVQTDFQVSHSLTATT
jgi:hypothetical protein